MFKDKVVVVTGASRGIGKAIALAFVENGAKVFGIARSAPTYQPSPSDSFIPLSFDLSKTDNIKSAATTLLSQTTHVDILVNCAGIKKRTTFAEPDPAAFDQTLAINLRAPYLLSQELLPALKDGSSIINITSQSGVGYVTTSLEYGMSKAALSYLTKAMAKVLADKSIRVNGVSPGRTYSELTAYDKDPEKEKLAIENIPLHHINQPEEIANLVLFLSSPQAANITGQVVAVDGGECIV